MQLKCLVRARVYAGRGSRNVCVTTAEVGLRPPDRLGRISRMPLVVKGRRRCQPTARVFPYGPGRAAIVNQQWFDLAGTGGYQ